MAFPKSWSWLIQLAVALGLVIGGCAFVLVSRRNLRESVERDLLTVAQFKAEQISSWLAERRGDAEILCGTLSQSAEALAVLQAPPSQSFRPKPALAEARQHLLELFGKLSRAYGYSEVMLTDPAGAVLLSMHHDGGVLDEEARAVLALAIEEDGPRLDDLHVCAFAPVPHTSLIAPIHRGRDMAGEVLGAIVLVTEARDFLYPLIRSWPHQSRTAESVLVRQDGDSVLILSELRHASNAALRLRFPLTQSSLPAVMAVQGMTGVRLGVDYRGAEVLSASVPIPGTPWIVVAKEDASESLSMMRQQSMLIGLLVAMLLVLALAGLFVFRQREKKLHYRTLFEAEQRQRRSSSRHQVVLHSIGDAVIATDAAGRVNLMNPEAEHQTGWSAEEAQGRPLEEVFRIINEETRLPVESPVTRVLRERQVVGLANHTVLVAKDGRERPIADSGAPVLEEDGGLAGVVLVFRDQTEEREAQRELLESERRFRSTFELAAVGVAHVALDGRYLRVNRKLCELVDLPRELLLSKSYQDITHPEDLAGDSEFTNQLLTEEVPHYTREKRYLTPQGEVVWVEVTVSLIREADGEPAYFISVVQDISRRKHDEIERNRLLAAIEQAAEAVVMTDTQASIVYVNPAFERISGYSKEEALGRNPSILKSGKHDQAFYQEMWRALLAGEAYECRMVNRRKDGGHFIEQATISPVRDAGGRVVNYVAVKRDVTKESHLEDQLRQSQKMEAVGRLAGGVAHDFNNILQAILGYGMMLQELLASETDEAEFAKEIVKGADRAAALTRQLLAFSRKQTIAPRILDLNDTVVGMLKLLGRLIGENIDLQWKPSFSLQPVLMDPEQLNQILANLVVNARDAIPGNGSICIETGPATFDEAYCAAHEGARPGCYSMLAISDTGVGMDEGLRSKIFEPFFTTKEVGKGTGLGLSTVYGIVKQNDGFINVYSEVGQGTTFRIYLPVVEDVAKAAAAESKPSADVQGGSETILLVEDELPLLRFAAHLLQSMGYTVLSTDNPLQALELARAHAGKIQLLLTDVVMPGMSGRDLQEKLGLEIPGLKCLFMSGYTSDIIAQRGILDEGVNFLAKPFTRSDLALKLRQMLNT